MLVCFEGPDCTGKTSQSEILEEYIKENYPGLNVWRFHFPMNQTLRGMLSGSLKVNNPYHFQMMFLTDFYNAIYEKKLPIINHIQSYKDVVIFDRYYYSTLIMAKHTIDPNYVEGFEEKDIEDYKTDLDIFVRDALAKIDIPHPDLTFVLMSRWEQIEKRLNEKKKDSYESNMKIMKDVYSAYVESLNNQDDIYHSNRESLAPVVISSTKNITPKVVFGTDLEYGYLNKLAALNYKTKQEISAEIAQVFDIFLSEFMNRSFFEIIIKEKKTDEFAGKEFDMTEKFSKYLKGETFIDDKDIPIIKSYTKQEKYKAQDIEEESKDNDTNEDYTEITGWFWSINQPDKTESTTKVDVFIKDKRCEHVILDLEKYCKRKFKDFAMLEHEGTNFYTDLRFSYITKDGLNFDKSKYTKEFFVFTDEIIKMALDENDDCVQIFREGLYDIKKDINVETKEIESGIAKHAYDLHKDNIEQRKRDYELSSDKNRLKSDNEESDCYCRPIQVTLPEANIFDVKIVKACFNKEWYGSIYIDNLDEFEIDIPKFITQKYGPNTIISRITNDDTHLYVHFEKDYEDDGRSEEYTASINIKQIYHQFNIKNTCFKKFKYNPKSLEPEYADIIKKITNVQISQLGDQSFIFVTNEKDIRFRFSAEDFYTCPGIIEQYSFDEQSIKVKTDKNISFEIGLFSLNSIYYLDTNFHSVSDNQDSLAHFTRFRYNHTYVLKDGSWIDATILQSEV